MTLEVGNTNVPRAIAGTYRPPGFNRIPAEVLAGARRLSERYRVTFRVLPLNATPGLRKADCLDGQRLWAHRRARSPVL